MNRLLHRRPSPALAISATALFVALGGTSYAAFSVPKNSVGTKQLKNNAVSTKKIKNGAVTGKKIKLSTLGTVPSAALANNANALQGQPASSFITTANLNRFRLLLAPGATDVTVDRDGALSIVAHCDSTGPAAFLYVRSTLAHSSYNSGSVSNLDFGPGDSTLKWAHSVSGSGNYEANNNDAVAVAPDGSVITMVSDATGYDIGSAPGKCIFAGANVNS